MVKQTLTPKIGLPTKSTQSVLTIKKNRKPRHVYPPCETCGKTNHYTEKFYFRADAVKRPPSRNRRPDGQNQVQQINAQNNSDVNVEAAAQTSN